MNLLITIALLLFISEFQLQQLTREVNNSKRHAYAEGSFKNLHVQWRSYFMSLMEDVLKPPGSLLATDRSKAVVLV